MRVINTLTYLGDTLQKGNKVFRISQDTLFLVEFSQDKTFFGYTWKTGLETNRHFKVLYPK